MMTLLALTGTPEAVEKASEQALGVVAQTALGATALVALAVAVLAVWKLSSVQDKRAADAKEASEKISKMVMDISKFQEETRRTIDALVIAEKSGEQMSREQSGLLVQIKTTLDTTIRDAVLRGGRSTTPGQGTQQPGRPGGRY